MVGVAREESADPQAQPPALWGVFLPEDVVLEAQKAVQFYLGQEPYCETEGLAAPFPWARVLYGLGHQDAVTTILQNSWGDSDVIREGISALVKVNGATWRHARLVEHGVLELKKGLLGSEQRVWSLHLKMLTSQMPELYELAETRVISTLQQLLHPLLVDEGCGGNLQLTDIQPGDTTVRWMAGLRDALQAEAFSRPIHIFCSI